MDEMNNKKKINPIIIVLVIVIIALLVGGIFLFMHLRKPQAIMEQDPNVFFNDEDAAEYLANKVTSIRITMQQKVYCYKNEEGKMMAVIGLENKNDFQYMVQFSLADTSEMIYTTGLVPPGGTIDEIPVETAEELKPGTYSVNAMFSAISEEDNKTDLGTSAINIDMVVQEE